MEKTLHIEIENIRGISKMTIDMPLGTDVYAITGVNGSGKSTLMMAVAPKIKRPVTFAMFKNGDYDSTSSIKYQIEDKYEVWKPINGNWCLVENNGQIDLEGFQEGSITRGTRFWNTTYHSYKRLLHIDKSDLVEADKFISESLSQILHGDIYHYPKLYRIDRRKAKEKYNFDGVPYFLSNERGTISQFSMSTGECLLINLLHLLYNLVIRTNNKKHKLILIDEIELALHPSAIKRLIKFMKNLAKKYNLTVYFATHSIEIIRDLDVNNLFYLEKGANNIVTCKTPCYPAYITRDIYMHDRHDVIILVEDDLAWNIVERFLKNIDAKRNKLIKVLPVGGYENILELHNNLLKERILGSKVKLLSIIDGDVKQAAEKKLIEKKRNGQWTHIDKNDVLFLPIESLEKYLKTKLFDNPDQNLMREIRDNLFENETKIDWFLNEYRKNIENAKKEDLKKNGVAKDDKDYFVNGKVLFNVLISEAKKNNWNESNFRKELCELILRYDSFKSFEDKLSKILKKRL